jgi:hypothetical protein
VTNAKAITLEDEKKIITLRKILDAEIFTLEELEKSECIQKMINIIRIGQLTYISNLINDQQAKPDKFSP